MSSSSPSASSVHSPVTTIHARGSIISFHQTASASCSELNDSCYFNCTTGNNQNAAGNVTESPSHVATDSTSSAVVLPSSSTSSSGAIDVNSIDVMVQATPQNKVNRNATSALPKSVHDDVQYTTEGLGLLEHKEIVDASPIRSLASDFQSAAADGDEVPTVKLLVDDLPNTTGRRSSGGIKRKHSDDSTPTSSEFDESTTIDGVEPTTPRSQLELAKKLTRQIKKQRQETRPTTSSSSTSSTPSSTLTNENIVPAPSAAVNRRAAVKKVVDLIEESTSKSLLRIGEMLKSSAEMFEGKQILLESKKQAYQAKKLEREERKQKFLASKQQQQQEQQGESERVPMKSLQLNMEETKDEVVM